MLPAIIIFEQDGTIAESKQPITRHTAQLIAELEKLTRIAFLSGESISLLEECVTAQLPSEALIDRLYLLPTNGSELYTYKSGERITLYASPFTREEVERIANALTQAARETGVINLSSQPYGERIEDRGSQVTFAALGQKAPGDVKRAWDPDYSKRNKLRDAVAALLPEYRVKWGGTTSIDVTRPEGDKAKGIVGLSDHLRVPVRDMVYVGNNVSPGGYNEIVKESGIRTIDIDNPHDADRFIEMMLQKHGNG
jgi:phosphomannomutase